MSATRSSAKLDLVAYSITAKKVKQTVKRILHDVKLNPWDDGFGGRVADEQSSAWCDRRFFGDERFQLDPA